MPEPLELQKVQYIKNIFNNGYHLSKSHELLIYCFYCNHHKQKLSINLEMNCFKCWVCEHHGNIYDLLQDSKKSFDRSIFNTLFSYKAKKDIKDEKKNVSISLPKEYEPIFPSLNSICMKRPLSYLKNRQIDEDIILKYHFGFCFDGDYADRIIIPSFDKIGNINFFTGRTINKNNNLSYLNCKNLPKGHKNLIICNEINVDYTNPIVIVEGYFDMFKSIENTIPLCGSSLPIESSLFKNLVENKTDVILALDPDALKKHINIAKNMLSYGLNVFSVKVSPYKDMGQMTKQEAKLRIENAEKETERSLFKKRASAIL